MLLQQTIGMHDSVHHTDSDTWNSFKMGDVAAFSTLYTRYFHMLLMYGRRMHTSNEFLKDCAQDLFAELWRNRKHLSVPPSVKNYLLKSMRNRIARNYQRDRISQYEIKEDYHTEVSPSRELQLITIQLAEEKKYILRSAIKHLTRRQREAIVMIYYYGATYADTATAMAISIDAVYNLVSKGVHALKRVMIHHSL